MLIFIERLRCTCFTVTAVTRNGEIQIVGVIKSRGTPSATTCPLVVSSHFPEVYVAENLMDTFLYFISLLGLSRKVDAVRGFFFG